MKFCIVSHKVTKGDGQGRVNYEVANEVIRRGHHLTLLASDISQDLEENSNVDWFPILVDQYPTEIIRNLIFSAKSRKWLNQHQDDIDVVKLNGAITSTASDMNAAHFIHSSWLNSLVSLNKNRKHIYNLYQWTYTKLNSAWEKRAFKRTTVIVAVSHKVAHELEGIDIPSSKIKVITNGVDLEEFCPAQVSREDLLLPQDVTLALYVGDIRTHRKNLDTVIKALVDVPGLHLAVAGCTSGSPFPTLAKSLGIDSRIHFLGYRNDIANLMQAADLFVFPSRYEPFGLVILEAMAAGLPIVTAVTVGASELVTEDCGVVLPDPNDISGLADAISQLVNHPLKMKYMGKAARKVAEEHSWVTMAKQYVDILENLESYEELSSNCNLSSSAGLAPMPSGS